MTITISELSVEEGVRAAGSIVEMSPPDRPDAIFTANDVVAIGALTCFLRHGIRVPAEISIVGFDDIALARQAVVPLPTIRQPAYQIGRAAGTLLLDQLENVNAAPPEIAPFAAELVIRESTRVIQGPASP